MFKRGSTQERTLEICLVLVTIGISTVLWTSSNQRITVLNLFYLPVVLAGFFLGRYRAGVLALLSVVTASAVVVSDIFNFASISSPVAVGLGISVWAAVLGLTAILVGTLSDDRTARKIEAHEAHVGVVEVLSRYLASANPKLKMRAMRVAELSQRVAKHLRLAEREVDDIRVAALLLDMENIEITAKVIKKAVGELGEDPEAGHTFHGTDLVQSLGQVLSGAFPILLNQSTLDSKGTDVVGSEIPFGAHIIRTVRAYDNLANDVWAGMQIPPGELIDELRSDSTSEHHPAVLHALELALDVKPVTSEAPKAGSKPKLETVSV